ncbi:MAG: alpha/beta fold hydrolase [Chloroflexi bacterium]|nr:alpha/beta fold hydrolase [Chloroflexota bacterium]
MYAAYIALMMISVFCILAIASTVLYGVHRLIHPRRTRVGGTPSDYGLPYESVSFPSLDGITIRGWFVPTPNSRGTVIFCHGYAGNKAPDLQYVPRFRDHGYNVLLFDFRAHGESDGNKSSLVYYERQDLLGAIAYLQQRGINQVGLLGFSMGAAVAMATAPLSAAVRAVIADSGFAELRTILTTYMQNKGMPRPIASAMAALIIWAAGWLLGCSLPEGDPLRWVSRLAPRPLFLIHGELDRSVPASDARRLYEAASHPKELWIAPGAEHRAVDQLYPDEYMARVLTFFDQWLASQPVSRTEHGTRNM